MAESAPSPREQDLAPLNFRAVVRQLRPRQWTKNAAVLAPLLFAKAVFDPSRATHAIFAAISFCMVASGIYTINDWIDREKDRIHPEKRHRPIASGMISGTGAVLIVLCLWTCGFAIAVAVGMAFTAVLALYTAMQIAYSVHLKQIVILDVLIIAAGFVFRVIAGAVAITAPVSNWLYLCTLLLALFLGFAKRRHEVASLRELAGQHRENLSDYSLTMLDQFIAISVSCCVLAYGLYAVAPETVARMGSDNLKYTVPLVMYGFFRYLFLIHRRQLGGSPEKVLLSDYPLIICILLFVAGSGLVVYRG